MSMHPLLAQELVAARRAKLEAAATKTRLIRGLRPPPCRMLGRHLRWRTAGRSDPALHECAELSPADAQRFDLLVLSSSTTQVATRNTTANAARISQ
jgi:hypothetical protein